MSVTIEQANDTTKIAFKGDMSVAVIAELTTDVFEYFRHNNPDNIAVCLKDVSVFDTSALQLLLMIETMAIKCSGTFVVSSVNDQSQSVIECIGLADRWVGVAASQALDRVNFSEMDS